MKTQRLERIGELFKTYLNLCPSKEALLTMLNEAELAERVYNSNAIENSSVTLPETEEILFKQKLSRRISLREIFETKNLALVYSYIQKNQNLTFNIENILLLHKMLLTNIDNKIAGQLRQKDELVRVGSHIAVPGEFVVARLQKAIDKFKKDLITPYLHKVASFHSEFENIHPFADGNGRIGRVINNWLLSEQKFPVIIVRNKNKKNYYQGLRSYDASFNPKLMHRFFELAMLESLHKRLAYLQNLNIMPLVKYAKLNNQAPQKLLNSARRQTIAAFREKGVWKIGLASTPLESA